MEAVLVCRQPRVRAGGRRGGAGQEGEGVVQRAAGLAQEMGRENGVGTSGQGEAQQPVTRSADNQNIWPRFYFDIMHISIR